MGEVLLLAGPTASGKTKATLAIAEARNVTIINADSMQVYRDLSVITARPTPPGKSRVRPMACLATAMAQNGSPPGHGWTRRWQKSATHGRAGLRLCWWAERGFIFRR